MKAPVLNSHNKAEYEPSHTGDSDTRPMYIKAFSVPLSKGHKW